MPEPEMSEKREFKIHCRISRNDGRDGRIAITNLPYQALTAEEARANLKLFYDTALAMVDRKVGGR